MTNKVRFGLEKVHYAVITSKNGGYTYEDPKPVPGAVSLSLDPTGDSSSFYADNGIYYASSNSTGYTGSITIATLTDEFRTDVLGEVLIDGGLMESANSKPKDIALLFQVSGDAEEDKFVFYDVTVARPSQSANTTTESKEVSTQELSFTAKPRVTDKKIRWVTGTATSAQAKSEFFTVVQEPYNGAI